MVFWRLRAGDKGADGRSGAQTPGAGIVINMKYTDLAPKAMWDEMLAERMIAKSTRDDGKLELYNYTANAQWSRTWNEVTINARGLVVEAGTGEIVGRPMRKFFSPTGQEIPPGTVEVSEKLDGSLGIIYFYEGKWQITTRGTFNSGQAAMGAKLLSELGGPVPGAGTLTWLVEIIYPENRLVVDYEGARGLFLVAAVQTATGRSLPLSQAQKLWPGRSAEVFQFENAEDAIKAPARGGREGLVLHFTETDERMKLKYPEYVRIHKIVTEVSELRVWESLVAGDDIIKTLDGVPDEAFEFVKTTRDELQESYRQLEEKIKEATSAAEKLLAAGATRKEVAQTARGLEPWLRSGMFLALDKDDYSKVIWKKLRPESGVSQWSKTAGTGIGM